MPRLTEVGIKHMAVYIPRTAVSQSDLEKHDGVSSGKYTIGLGQSHMSFITDCEDVVSLALTAVSHLMRSTKISYTDVGRLEVGTETIIDKSKSIKTSLMRLFTESGNVEVEGLDCTNACYGATAALFNSVAWAESTAWDGRYAIVVATDIAIYAPGPARATGGAAAVAMLIGRGSDVAIRFEVGLRATCMGNTYDFYKPKVNDEYPIVNGQETIDTFYYALDRCYERYVERASTADDETFDVSGESLDYCIFHAPFNKLVRKSFARLMYNDLLRSKAGTVERFKSVEEYRGIGREKLASNRKAQDALLRLSQEAYENKCGPATWVGKEIGNCYTASLYSSLAGLISEKGRNIVGKRLLMFSFGSGFAASMFSLRFVGSVEKVLVGPKLRDYLAERVVASAEEYERWMEERERNYGRFAYEPKAKAEEELFKGTWYLKKVGAKGERSYDQLAYR